MKLNLLPTYVSKEGQSKAAWLVMGAMSLAAVAGAIGAAMYSNDALAKATARVTEAQPYYDKCKQTAQLAEDIMAGSVVVDRNLKLAKAMMDHSTVYPDLYEKVLGYIPSFYRVNSMTITPGGPDTCNVTMVGTIKSFQQYADVMLALLRIPGATNVARGGFVDNHPFVPGLNEQDQDGRAVKPGEGNLPSNAIDRLDALVARASQAPTGFLNVNGFGAPDALQKGAMPEWSLVTLSVTLSGTNIQTPDPRATLSQQGAGQAGNTPPASGPGGLGGNAPAPGNRPGGGGGGPTAGVND